MSRDELKGPRAFSLITIPQRLLTCSPYPVPHPHPGQCSMRASGRPSPASTSASAPRSGSSVSTPTPLFRLCSSTNKTNPRPHQQRPLRDHPLCRPRPRRPLRPKIPRSPRRRNPFLPHEASSPLLHPRRPLFPPHHPVRFHISMGDAVDRCDARVHRRRNNNHQDGWGDIGELEQWSWGIEFPRLDALLWEFQSRCVG